MPPILSLPVRTSGDDSRLCAMMAHAIIARIEEKIYEPSIRLDEKSLDRIKRQKTQPQLTIKRIRQGHIELDELFEAAMHDTNLLFAGKLTRESALLCYTDERIFDVAVPAHVVKVLSSSATEPKGHPRNVCLFHKLIELMNHIDKDLALEMAQGFRTIGRGDVTGLWPLREGGVPDHDVSDFFNTAIRFRQGSPGLDDELLDFVISEIEADVKLGRYAEIRKEQLRCPFMTAFGVRQKNKIRVIVDERLKNSFSSLPEKVRLKGSNYLLEAIRAFCCDDGQEANINVHPQRAKEAWKSVVEELQNFKDLKVKCEGQTPSLDELGRKISEAILRKNAGLSMGRTLSGNPPAAFLRDFKKAYHMMGIATPEYNPVGAFDRKADTWRYFTPFNLTMGNTHSVTNWCRVAEFCEAAYAYFADALSFVYIDDATILAASPELMSMQMELVDKVNRSLGLDVSDKPEARQDSESNDWMMILGLEYRFGKNETTLRVPEKKKKAIDSTCLELIQTLNAPGGRIDVKDIQKVVGTLVWALFSSHERSGAAILHGLYPFAFEDGFNKRIKKKREKDGLRRTLHLVRQTVKEMDDIVVTRETAVRRSVHVFTDASSDGGPNGEAALGVLVIDDYGNLHCTSLPVTCERIDILELRAVLLALETFTPVLNKKHINLHIDNAGDLFSLIRGSHRSGRGTAIIHKSLRLLVEMGSTVFFDYVKSELNPADAYTRTLKEDRVDKWLKPKRWTPKAAANAEITRISRPVALEGRTEAGPDPCTEIFPQDRTDDREEEVPAEDAAEIEEDFFIEEYVDAIIMKLEKLAQATFDNDGYPSDHRRQ